MTALDYFLRVANLPFTGSSTTRFVRSILPWSSIRDQTSAHLLLAVCYLNMQPKRLSEAASSLDTCIRSNSDLAGLYLLRALVLGEEGNSQDRLSRDSAIPAQTTSDDAFEAAEADYRRAFGLPLKDDSRYVLLANRGLLRLQSDRFDEAVADLKRPSGFGRTSTRRTPRWARSSSVTAGPTTPMRL